MIQQLRRTINRHAPRPLRRLVTRSKLRLDPPAARLRRALQAGGPPPVIIYQMGKVGSSSIYESLRQQGDRLVFQVHTLNAELAQAVWQRAERDPAARYTLLHAWISQQIGPIICTERERPIDFITLVRDPIAVQVAGLFENIDSRLGITYQPGELPLDTIIDQFNSEQPEPEYFDWFDRQMKGSLGIDVYAHPFPAERGYTTIVHGNYRLLILRTELPDTAKATAIADFLGLPTLDIVRANFSAEKAYAADYAAFKARVRFTPAYLETALNSKLVQHFFTPDEIVQLRQKWSPSTGD